MLNYELWVPYLIYGLLIGIAIGTAIIFFIRGKLLIPLIIVNAVTLMAIAFVHGMGSLPISKLFEMIVMIVTAGIVADIFMVSVQWSREIEIVFGMILIIAFVAFIGMGQITSYRDNYYANTIASIYKNTSGSAAAQIIEIRDKMDPHSEIFSLYDNGYVLDGIRTGYVSRIKGISVCVTEQNVTKDYGYGVYHSGNTTLYMTDRLFNDDTKNKGIDTTIVCLAFVLIAAVTSRKSIFS